MNLPSDMLNGDVRITRNSTSICVYLRFTTRNDREYDTRTFSKKVPEMFSSYDTRMARVLLGILFAG